MKPMIKKIGCLAAVGVLAVIMFSGCGIQIDATLNKDMTSTVKETVNLSEFEYALWFDGIEDSGYKETEIDGEKRYLLDTEYNYTKQDLLDDYQVKATDKYIVIRGESLMQAEKGADINIALPFTIAATNGKKISDNVVHFDTSMIDMTTDDMTKPQ